MKNFLFLALSASLLTFGASVNSSPALADSVLDKVIKNKEIFIGTRESTAPYAYVESDGTWTGWSVEMSRAMVGVISKKTGVELKATLKAVTPQTRIPLILNGSNYWNWGATGISLKRQEAVDFSHVVNSVCVKKLTPVGSGIKSIDDLAGKRVGVTKASIEERLLNSMNKEGKFNPPVKIVSFDKHPNGFLGLQQGKTDAHVTLDDALHRLKMKTADPSQWEVTGPDLFCINQGMILPNNDSKWSDTVNGAFCYMVKTGMYREIYDEWFQGPNPKAGYVRDQSAGVQRLLSDQCPYKSETFIK
ncbi:transporter substrate-binding domain-containing protein [Candidatus Puniceispirillum sp.]|nr:transporter substrate-binding domain-containing protein [Candidatus Puniceispirillum sp.]